MATSVLIVDDHPGFRASARLLLESEGWDVVGEAARRRARACAAAELQPDLVLLDIQLPDIDGFEVSSRLLPNGTRAGRDPGVEPRPRGPKARWSSAARRPRLHPQGRAVRRGAGGAASRDRPAPGAVGLAVAGFIAGVVPLVLALSAPDDIDDPALSAVFGPLVGWAFIGTGLFAWYRRPENNFGTLMAAVGFMWFVVGLPWIDDPGVFIVGLALRRRCPSPSLFHMLLAFPHGRLDDARERSVVALGYFVTTVLWWVTLLFYDTRAATTGPSNPLQAFDDQGHGRCAARGPVTSSPSPHVAVGVVLRQRWLRARARQRAGAGAGATSPPRCSWLLLVTLARGSDAGCPTSVEAVIDVAGLVSLVLIPFAFLGGLLRSRLSRAGAVTELVARLSERDPAPRGLRDALAKALGDPGLMLAYPLPGTRAYVDAEGRRWSCPSRRPAARGHFVERRRRARGRHRARRVAQDERELSPRSAPRPRSRWRTSASRPSCARRSRSCAPSRTAADRGRHWPSAAGWSATCTTARSSGWCRSR